MKNRSTIIASRLLRLGAVALILGLVPVGFAKGGTRGTRGTRGATTKRTTVIVELSDAEKADLTFMREEEKVARDVYLSLYGVWDEVIFSKIARSEQTHMNAVGKLLVKYGLPDPVADLGVGQFSTPEFQTMHDELVALGSASLVDALLVGVFVEETDIADLTFALSETNVKDITKVYTNLRRGSQRHLAAFNFWLAQQNIEE